MLFTLINEDSEDLCDNDFFWLSLEESFRYINRPRKEDFFLLIFEGKEEATEPELFNEVEEGGTVELLRSFGVAGGRRDESKTWLGSGKPLEQ